MSYISSVERWNALKNNQVFIYDPDRQSNIKVDIFRLEGTLAEHVLNRRVFVFERLNEYFQNVGYESDDVGYVNGQFVGGYRMDVYLLYSNQTFYVLSVSQEELEGIRTLPNWMQTQGSVHWFFTPVELFPLDAAGWTGMNAEDVIQMFRFGNLIPDSLNNVYENSDNLSKIQKFTVHIVKSRFLIRSGRVVHSVFNREQLRYNYLERNETGEVVPSPTREFGKHSSVLIIPVYLKDTVNRNQFPIYDLSHRTIIQVQSRFGVTQILTYNDSDRFSEKRIPMPTDGEQILESLSIYRRLPFEIEIRADIPDWISTRAEYLYKSTDNKFYVQAPNRTQKEISAKEFEIIVFAIKWANSQKPQSPPFIKVYGIWIRPWLTYRIQRDNNRNILVDGKLLMVSKN